MKSSDPRAVLSAAQLERVDALLDALLDVPEDQRIDRLSVLRIDDHAVLQEVTSLLRATIASKDFLTSRPRGESRQMAARAAPRAWRHGGCL